MAKKLRTLRLRNKKCSYKKTGVYIVPVHDPAQLLPDVISRLETPVVDEVIVAPLRVLHVLLERVVHVQQSQVIAVDVREPSGEKPGI